MIRFSDKALSITQVIVIIMVIISSYVVWSAEKKKREQNLENTINQKTQIIQIVKEFYYENQNQRKQRSFL
jgi:hypothetical protein